MSECNNNKKMQYSIIQKTAGQRIPLNRHMERYPMSSSDLLSSNSSSDEDLIYRNIRLNSSIERPFRMPSIVDEFTQRPPEIQPHSMLNTCIKCNRIRTNPKFRYSYTSCRSKLHDNKRFSTSDGQYENSDNSSEDACKSQQRRAFHSNRRRIKFKNQLR